MGGNEGEDGAAVGPGSINQIGIYVASGRTSRYRL